MPIHDLTIHPAAYVSVGELARYWCVSRKQIYKQIDAGTLAAIRLGPRLFRIRTCVARDFEESARMAPGNQARVEPANRQQAAIDPGLLQSSSAAPPSARRR